VGLMFPRTFNGADTSDDDTKIFFFKENQGPCANPLEYLCPNLVLGFPSNSDPQMLLCTNFKLIIAVCQP
jgi:hypothetical protein